MTATPWIDLLSPGLRFHRVTIPGSAPPVELVRLHADPVRAASVSLVRFAVGWRRPGTGHYPCAEEFLILRGGLLVSATRYTHGDYGFLPPLATRSDSRSETGCLALAWFSGPPVWIDGVSELAPSAQAFRRGPAHMQHREPVPDVPGEAGVVDELPGDVQVPTELISLSTWRWSFILSGQSVPRLPDPVFIRTWER